MPHLDFYFDDISPYAYLACFQPRKVKQFPDGNSQTEERFSILPFQDRPNIMPPSGKSFENPEELQAKIREAASSLRKGLWKGLIGF